MYKYDQICMKNDRNKILNIYIYLISSMLTLSMKYEKFCKRAQRMCKRIYRKPDKFRYTNLYRNEIKDNKSKKKRRGMKNVTHRFFFPFHSFFLPVVICFSDNSK